MKWGIIVCVILHKCHNKEIFMKASLRIAILLLIATLLFGCAEKEPEIPLEEIALQQLSAAYKNMETAGTYHLTATVEKQIKVGSEIFTESRSQKISCSAFNSEQPELSAKETITIGNLEYVQSKHYQNGIAFLMMEDGNFSSACAFDEISGSLAPYFIIDPTLYKTVSVEKADGALRVSFQDPTQAESWISSEGTFIAANGYVVLSEAGELYEMGYTLTTDIDGTQLTQTVTATPQDATPVDTTIPNEIDCMRISSIQSPEILESACAFLQQAVNIDSETQTVTVSDAFGLKRTQTTELSMRGQDETFQADVSTQVTQTDASRDSKPSVMKQVEKFSGGQYTVTVDNEKPNAVEGVTAQSMRKYCQDILLGNILLPQYLNEANLSKSDKMTITFNATKEMADIIRSNISQTLYNDPTFLESVSDKIENKAMKCYLTVQSGTGLPVAAGMTYEGTHNIDNATYLISYKFDQTYTPVDVPAEETAE